MLPGCAYRRFPLVRPPLPLALYGLVQAMVPAASAKRRHICIGASSHASHRVIVAVPYDQVFVETCETRFT